MRLCPVRITFLSVFTSMVFLSLNSWASWESDFAHAYNKCLEEKRMALANAKNHCATSGSNPEECLNNSTPVKSGAGTEYQIQQHCNRQAETAASNLNPICSSAQEQAGLCSDDVAAEEPTGDFGNTNLATTPAPATKNPNPPPPAGRTDPIASEPAPKQSTTKDPAAQASPPQPQPQPAQRMGQTVQQAQAEAQSDINSCISLQARANQCCGNPLSCASGQTQQAVQRLNQPPPTNSEAGMRDYCNQMSQLNNQSASINNELSSVCLAPQSSCQNTCGSLAQKYQSKLSSCAGCEAQSVYSSALNTLNSYRNSCSQLYARGAAMGVQGASTNSGTAMGGACQNLTAASPSANNPSNPVQGQVGGWNPDYTAGAGSNNYGNQYGSPDHNDVYGCQSNPNSAACVSCSQNPNSKECQALREATEQKQGSVGFGNTADNGLAPPAFNVQGLPSAGDQFNGITPSPYQGEPTQNPVVANNTGGGIGTGAEGGADAAKLGGRPMPVGRGINTDIDQGLRSGGGGGGYAPHSATGSGFSDKPYAYGAAQRGAGDGRQAGKNDGGFLGMDLKQYLPGGRRHPSGLGTNGWREINGKSENIWRRISMKIEEKCRLGVLLQCKP